MNRIIQRIDFNVRDVDPERCPLCPECDMPLEVGESITLQTCDVRDGHLGLVRLIHSDCLDCGVDDDWGEDEDE